VETEPVGAQPIEEPSEIPSEIPSEEPSDKPFDDEPFDAGVEADEQTDPKTYIEQLSGKLGQTLRSYTEDLGEPDFDLEKFAINSVISATNSSQMDEQDQNDIIEKIKTAGNTSSNDDENDGGDDNNTENDGDGESDGESDGGSDGINVDDLGGDLEDDLSENTGNFLINPKKSSIFAPKGSKEYEEMVKKKLDETFNQGSDVEPAVKPVVKPTKTPEPIKPIRRNKPFQPTPTVVPIQPKAVSETGSSVEKKTDVMGLAKELASVSKNINDMIAKQNNFFNDKQIEGGDVSKVISQAAELIKNR